MSIEMKKTYDDLWFRFGYATHSDDNFREFQLTWFLKRFGLDSHSFHEIIDGKTALEVGTGSGAFLRNLIIAKAAYGLDQSEAGTDIARQVYYKDHKNIHIITEDLMKHGGQYDVVIADQVLHHLPDTYKALEKTVSLVTPGGVIMFYVYKKKVPVREFVDTFLRWFTTRLSQKNCLLFSEFMLWLGKTLTRINLPLQRWVYWNIAKCFYNETFSHDNNLRVNYDWYSPKIAHRHTEEEAHLWIKKLNITPDHINIGDSGISVRAHVGIS